MMRTGTIQMDDHKRIRTYVLAKPVVADPPVKCVIAVGSMAVTGLVEAVLIETLCDVAVRKVDIGIEVDVRPIRFLQNATEPSLPATIDRTLKKGRRLGFLGAGPLQGVGAVSDGKCGFPLVISGVAKSLRVVDVQRACVVAALLVVERKYIGRLHLSSFAKTTAVGEGCAESKSGYE
jgi:hypothetical protein